LFFAQAPYQVLSLFVLFGRSLRHSLFVRVGPRGGFEPLRDMVGGGPFNLRPGQWTDDTSMALCLAESLTEKGGFDAWDHRKNKDTELIKLDLLLTSMPLA